MSTAVATVASVSQPIQWDQELRGMQYLLKSGLLPATVKSPETALFIVLTGRDLGMSPVQSLRSIHVIQGKVEVSADAQLGLFHRAGGKSQFVTLTDAEAVLELRAAWLVQPHRESFTMDDAKRAKLGGDNWQKYPKAMLRSRAITAGLKSIGFDATAGIYAPGEITGVEAVDLVTGEVLSPPEPTPDPKASDKQLDLLVKMLKSHVWTADERYDYGCLLGDMLTAQAASNLIDTLTAEGKRRKAAEKQVSAEEVV